MAKRRTYEEKLLDDLKGLPANKWFKIDGREDFEKITVAVKSFINMGEHFEFSECYTKIRRLVDKNLPQLYSSMKQLPEGITIEKISTGHRETITIQNKNIVVEHSTGSYRIFNNNRLIAIESVK